MHYNPGEILLYKGFSGSLSTVSTYSDEPDYEFNIETFEFDRCTDADRNNYTTVRIGTQVWMAENLKATKFRDGTLIPLVTENSGWHLNTTPAHCYYDNDHTNYIVYGGLYNWYTASNEMVCPEGWHVPTDRDWTTLTTYLGNESIAGSVLKEAGTINWKEPNTGATNQTGFTALPEGYRDISGGFYGAGELGCWWSNSMIDVRAYNRMMSYSSINVTRSVNNKKYGMSVRCIKGNIPETVYDNDENPYTEIVIGNQVWMGENLKTTRLRDGTTIPLVTDNTSWEDLTGPGFCWYNNDNETNRKIYGALYNWHTVNTSKLCPAGWHVPDYIEWLDILHTSGGEDIAGGKMKETGISHWSDPNTGATNESGFTALPAGSRIVEQGIYSGIFLGLKTAGYWWTSSPQVCADEWGGSYHLNYDNDDLGFVCRYRASGLSVRCVKDE